MSQPPPGRAWSVLGTSIRGSSHARLNLCNQDSITAWRSPAPVGLPLVLCVSDGHGSRRCFRSHLGAKFAGKIATAVLRDAMNRLPAPPPSPNARRDPGGVSLSLINRTAEQVLPREIWRAWCDAARRNVRRFPFTAAELDRLDAAERDAVADNPLLAYGATLIAVAVTEAFILYLQIGDGDVLAVSADGRVARPVPPDERLRGNETTSLCSPDAWADFRTRLQPVGDQPPALILASTDGYANSFDSDKGFLDVGPDVLRMIRTQGSSQVSRQLQGWLEEASRCGSGDDVTLGVVCSPTAFDPATGYAAA